MKFNIVRLSGNRNVGLSKTKGSNILRFSSPLDPELTVKDNKNTSKVEIENDSVITLIKLSDEALSAIAYLAKERDE